MQCKYFGSCASCSLHHLNYMEQLKYKVDLEKQRFMDIYGGDFDIIESKTEAFRDRAEFRIYHFGDKITYAMNGFEKQIVPIDSCSIVNKKIDELMKKLLAEVELDEVLKNRFFSVEFLSSSTNDILITMIYHKKLDEIWTQKAKVLQEKLAVKIIGRSRKQKLILKDDFVYENVSLGVREFKLQYREGGFTQPNSGVNKQMLSWVAKNIQDSDDLCELYCGGGNFTIPLSTKFSRVLATEISKTSIKSALQNCELNAIENIEFIRMSSEEFCEALDGVREFRRLKDIDLKSYSFLKKDQFSTIFVDPPRAGLDPLTTNLVKRFDQIIYISCNPQTLHRDLKEIAKSHKIIKFAFFDQFAYTNHIESGVILRKIGN